MKYYISDLHLFHRNVTKEGKDFDGRPYKTMEDMLSDIKERWNQKITNGDTVYILGDISLRGRNDELIGYVAQLRGHKILIKGNHDDVSDHRYQTLFDEICDYKEITDRIDKETVHLVLCHYPILMWNGQHRGTILLYGHVHGSAEETYFQNCLNRIGDIFTEESRGGDTDAVAINVGCMMPYMDYEPRTLEELYHSILKK